MELMKLRGTEYFINEVQRLKSMPYESRPKVLVYGDPDIDGLLSMREMFSFLEQELGQDTVMYYCNTNRSHGFTIPVDKVAGFSIFAVDFAISESKMLELVNAGVTIISIDHHDIEDQVPLVSKDGCVGVTINNQFSWEDESFSFLSGMGVVYHVISEYYESIGEDWYSTDETTIALVGLTLLSDVRNIEMPKARVYLSTLYNHEVEGYIGYLVMSVLGKDYTFGYPKMDRSFVDYTFSPKVNALFRFNLENIAIEFIMGEGYPNIDYQQKQRVFLEYLEEGIEIREFKNISFIGIPDDGLSILELSYVTNFIGLLASRYVEEDRVVVAYYKPKDGNIGRASFRGSIQAVDFRRELKKLGLDGHGHANAFGIYGFSEDYEFLSKIANRVSELVAGVETDVKYIEVSHLGLLVRDPRKGLRLCKENSFKLSHNMVHIKYTGDTSRIEKVRGSDRYAVYKVDGIEVRSFDLDLNFDNAYILPILERGRPVFQLSKEVK